MKDIIKHLLLSSLMLFGSVGMTAQELVRDHLVFGNFNSTSSVKRCKLLGVEEGFKDALKGKVTVPGHVEYEGNSYAVYTVEAGCFLGCQNITSIKIEDNEFTSYYFYRQAFANCTSLESIDFPAVQEVTISMNVFEGSTNLRTLVFRCGEVPSIQDSYALETSLKDVRLYVPDELVKEYAEVIKAGGTDDEGRFWSMFDEKKVFPLDEYVEEGGDDDDKPGGGTPQTGVRLTLGGAAFLFPEMEAGHRIVVTLPEGQTIGTDTNAYSVEIDPETNTHTITINSPSEAEVTVVNSGMTDYEAAAVLPATVRIVTKGNTLEILGLEEGAIVSVANSAGETVYHGRRHTLKLSRGVYVVGTPLGCRKVVL